MNVQRFIDNIIEQIKEAQLKLGFEREMIRLYFPVDSLCGLLELKYRDGKEVLAELKRELGFEDTVLGTIQFSLCRDPNRIEVCVSPDGAAYVQEEIPDPPFLSNIIRMFQENHNLTIEQIQSCFEQFNKHYVCEKMEPGNDFDYVLYFPEHNPDPWYYCVKIEMGHTIYHRFTSEDFFSLTY